MMSVSAEGASAAWASTASIASSTLRSGAAAMVRTLLVKRRPLLSSAASVKVPPISMPRRCCVPIRSQSSRTFTWRFVGGLCNSGEAGIRIGDALAVLVGTADRLINFYADLRRRRLGEDEVSVFARRTDRGYQGER